MADVFIDTNLLLYAVSTEPAETAKTAVARQCLQTSVWAWSAQVAAEFVRASTSPKQNKPLTRGEAKTWVLTWMASPMCSIDGALVVEAVELSERFQISHFDAQIIAAAKRMGCPKVWSEDLNHGQESGLRWRDRAQSFRFSVRARRAGRRILVEHSTICLVTHVPLFMLRVPCPPLSSHKKTESPASALTR